MNVGPEIEWSSLHTKTSKTNEVDVTTIIYSDKYLMFLWIYFSIITNKPSQ